MFPNPGSGHLPLSQPFPNLLYFIITTLDAK